MSENIKKDAEKNTENTISEETKSSSANTEETIEENVETTTEETTIVATSNSSEGIENSETEENTSEENTVVASSNSSEGIEKPETTELVNSAEEVKEEKVEEAKKDYSTLTKEELLTDLKTIIDSKPIQDIKNIVEEIRTEFYTKFKEDLEKNKEAFIAEGKNLIDFYYTTPLKKEFDSLYYEYKHKRNDYFKNLSNNLKLNLEKREGLIEELKSLFSAKEKTSTIYKKFKEIQEKWFEAGQIPPDKYNTVWKNYYHHVDNFYDILHLDREFREKNYKNNLEQKQRLIDRAEELTKEKDNNKAFRELQMLHKMWKEEIGPVAKEVSDEIWEKFSAATKIIHDKRHEHLKELDRIAEENVAIKKDIIDEIHSVTDSLKDKGHQAWQNGIKKVQELRDKFFASGKVPKAKNNEIWELFKDATRKFNKAKNSFYKNQKKEQFDNLAKKQELIKIAHDNKDSDDFDAVTPLMKKIQEDWRKIGHVPRKDSDKIWKEFKEVCNHFFDRLHSQKDEANKEEYANLDAKKSFLEELENLVLEGEHKKDIKTIVGKIEEWKKLGRVPYNKRDIEQKFNKKLDELFGKLDLDKKERELIKFENKLSIMASQEDDRKLKNEEFFISKKIGEVKDEIRQLENNLLFFKHVKDDNPLVKEVRKNIDKQKEQLDTWIEKLSKIRALRK